MVRGRILFLLLAGAINCAPAWLWAGGPLSDGTTNFQVTAVTQGGVRVSSCATAKLDNAVGEVGITTFTSASGYKFFSGFCHLISQPGTITDLFASTGSAPGSIDLSWTAMGSDGSTGTITGGKYRIDYSTDISHTFIVSTYEIEFSTNVEPGDDQFKTITEDDDGNKLLTGATYYIHIYLANSATIYSEMSNAATCQAMITPPGVSTPTFTDIFTSSFTVNWSSGTPATGYNAEGTHYDVKICTVPDFQSGTVSSSQTTILSAAFEDIWPNTTYYARAAAYYDSSTTTYTNLGSTSTLANQVENTQVYKVYITSITVNWKPLPTEEQEGSSSTCEGYILQASTEAGFVPLWDSSSTTGVSLSTLTIANLVGDNTYYFRVGSLNWNNVPNYAVPVSTELQVVLSVYINTDTYDFGTFTASGSTVTVSSISVINDGNISETYYIMAATVTPGSPWVFGSSPGIDVITLQGIFHPNQPIHDDFESEDQINNTNQQSQIVSDGGRYTFDDSETGVSVPANGNDLRGLWMRFQTPNSSSVNGVQEIQVTITAEQSD